MSVRGPFENVENLSAFAGTGAGYSYPAYHRRKVWFTQSKTERRAGYPLRFDSFGSFCKASGATQSLGQNNSIAANAVRLSGAFESTLTREDALLANRLYDKFRDKVMGETADMGAFGAEIGQAASMIVKRAGQMSQMYRAVRRGRFGDAYSYFVDGVKPRTVRKKAKDGGGLVLEYHFGWEPMLKDIYSACEVLQSSPSGKKVLAKVRSRLSLVTKTSDSNNDLYRELEISLFRRAQCVVQIQNPNLHLADQLGVINPAAVAWELVPFSFVVDWFIPVGDFLRSWTDFAGLSLNLAQNSFYRKAMSEERIISRSDGSIPLSDKAEAFYTARYDTAPPRTTLTPVRFKGLSPWRGASAISLLLQTFSDPRKPRFK